MDIPGLTYRIILLMCTISCPLCSCIPNEDKVRESCNTGLADYSHRSIPTLSVPTLVISDMTNYQWGLTGGDRLVGIVHKSFCRSFFDNVTGRCYEYGSEGPCPPYMVWVQESPDSELGGCGCKYNAKFPVAKSIENSQCYPLYHKANCREGEWFTVKNSDVDETFGECTRDHCTSQGATGFSWDRYAEVRRLLGLSPVPRGGTLIGGTPLGVDLSAIQGPIWYLYNSTCFRTFTQGHCGDRDELAIFVEGGSLPSCYTNRDLRCGPGGRAVGGGEGGYGCEIWHSAMVVRYSGQLKCAADYVRHGHTCVRSVSQRFVADHED